METFLSPAMRKRNEQEPDFETRIRDNPVALLLEVKSQINDNTQAIHPAQSMLQSLKMTWVLILFPVDRENMLKELKGTTRPLLATLGLFFTAYLSKPIPKL